MKVEAPIENQAGAYKRKAKEDMNEQDLAWLPLSAPEKKIAKAEDILTKVVPERTSYLADSVELFNIERDLKKFSFDLKITWKLNTVPSSRSTLARLFTRAYTLKSQLARLIHEHAGQRLFQTGLQVRFYNRCRNGDLHQRAQRRCCRQGNLKNERRA